MLRSICGVDCSACPLSSGCRGCAESGGRPFGRECAVAGACKRGEGELERLKDRIIAAANELGLEGLDEVKELNALKGSYINLEYELPGGARAKFWDDDAIYLGTFLPKAGTGRFYGLASDGEYLLAAESGPLGEDAELIVFKRLKV